MEVGSLLPKLKHCKSEVEVGQTIAQVLTESFDVIGSGTESLKGLTKRVYRAMIEARWNAG
jgi:hypothetical protein